MSLTERELQLIQEQVERFGTYNVAGSERTPVKHKPFDNNRMIPKTINQDWWQSKEDSLSVVIYFEAIMREAGASFRADNKSRIYRASKWLEEHGTSAHLYLLEKFESEKHNSTRLLFILEQIRPAEGLLEKSDVDQLLKLKAR